MVKEIVETIVKGGAATAGPPLGPKLGPMGINIGQVIAEINKKTEAMKGIDVPVKVVIDKDTKSFEVTIGTPSVASLLKKEFGLQKASGSPKAVKAIDTTIDHIIKIAQIKQDSLLANDLKSAVKEILGTCVSMGILVEGKTPQEIQAEVSKGDYDDKISGKTPLSFMDQKEITAKRSQYAAGIEALSKKEEAAPAAPAEAPADAKKAEPAKGASKTTGKAAAKPAAKSAKGKK